MKKFKPLRKEDVWKVNKDSALGVIDKDEVLSALKGFEEDIIDECESYLPDIDRRYKVVKGDLELCATCHQTLDFLRKWFPILEEGGV